MSKLLMSLVALAASATVFAEPPKPAAPAVNPANPTATVAVNPALDGDSTLKLLTSGGPGVYDFYKYDRTEIQAKYLDNVFQKQKVDYDYFLATVSAIEKGFGDLLRNNVYGENGLATISKRTVLGVAAGVDPAKAKTNSISAAEFLDAINAFNEAKIALDARIETLTAIAEGQVPSTEGLEPDESGIKKVPNYGQQNFAPIKKFYADRVAAIEKFASNLPHTVMLPGGVPLVIRANSGQGLVLATDQLEIEGKLMRITPETIKEMKEKIRALRTYDEDQEDDITEYTRYLQDRIFRFVETYGKSERYRKLGDVEQKKRDEAVRTILGQFWSRSYLRAVYGMPLCAIGVGYDKRWAHIEAWTMNTEALTRLHENPVCDANDMERVEQNYRNVLRRADARSEKIMDGNLGFFSGVENIMTFLGGKRNEAVSAQMMLRLLAADFYEERLLLETGNLKQMVERYRQRYYGNEDDEVFFRQLQMAYDKDITASKIREIYKDQGREAVATRILGGAEDDGFESKAGFGSGENLRFLFSKVVDVMDVKEQQLAQAAAMEEAIVNAQNPNNPFRVQTQKRKKNL